VPLGLLYGLIAAVGWGMTDVSATIAGRRIGPVALVATAQSLGLGVFVLAAVGSGTAIGATGLAEAVVFGSLASVGYLAAFAALRVGPLAVVSPVMSTWGGLTVVLAVVFRGERLGAVDIVGVALALIGIVLVGVVVDGSARRPRLVSAGIALALLADVGFGVSTVGLAGPIQAAGWLPITIVSRAANVTTAFVLIAVVAAARPRSLARVAGLDRSGWWALVGGVAAVGLLDATATISFSIGLERAETWLVGLASSFGPALAVVFAVGALGERLRGIQWLGLAVLAAGVIVLALPG
jgi:drug/metabolite transporter (DMT)-like permease